MVLVTYDLKSDHTKLKNALKELGWNDRIKGDNGSICYLPNTSLWKEGDNAAGALEQVRQILPMPNLERLMIVVFYSWAGILGEAFDR